MFNAIEYHKGSKRVDKILNFLKETRPVIIFMVATGDEDVEPFRETFVEIIEELSFGDKKENRF